MSRLLSPRDQALVRPRKDWKGTSRQPFTPILTSRHGQGVEKSKEYHARLTELERQGKYKKADRFAQHVHYADWYGLSHLATLRGTENNYDPNTNSTKTAPMSSDGTKLREPIESDSPNGSRAENKPTATVHLAHPPESFQQAHTSSSNRVQ